ncbi:NAD-dependent epimerase/dehydratase family protein [Temperatibacter marinus]|uniref:NAD-dependent epimerase/dehydratase family protein n=1 Tax=Temperatibacter marinus TaxID=1456591 RepID=A0AA52HA76_9PROT|nr:NAD-dependent epimerase/dehydratase family protein [Temperatibacter marinus]WND03337.1 NAD-dependent epimerase/dehydratase family protein [Temperatibacter marinus]
MKYLITGGMGFLGSHLAEELLKRGNEVTCLDLFEEKRCTHFRDWETYRLVIDTILNKPLVTQLVRSADAVIHLAAIAEPQQYVQLPRKTIEVNLKASLAILEEVTATNKLFFFSSTSEIYGKNTVQPFREDSDRILGSTDINRWCYSSAKAMVEHYINALHQEQLLEFVGIRIFNCYGPRLKGRVVSKFIDQVQSGKPIVIHGEGAQQRCFTYVSDLVNGIISLIETKSSHGSFYNIGNPKEEYSVKQLAQVVSEQLNQENYPITHVDRAAYGPSYQDLDRRVPSIDKISKAINWSPTVSLQEGISKMIEYNNTFGNNS